MLNIFLTNLGKYNEGYLIGEWVDLPVSDEELETVKKRIGINKKYEEWFITDFETDFNYEVSEYADIEELNEIAQIIEDLDDTEKEIFKALLSEGYNTEKSLEKIKNQDYMYFSDCDDMEDVAMAYIEETGMLQNVPNNIARYFDYEAFGHDMSFEGQYIFLDNGDCVEIF